MQWHKSRSQSGNNLAERTPRLENSAALISISSAADCLPVRCCVLRFLRLLKNLLLLRRKYQHSWQRSVCWKLKRLFKLRSHALAQTLTVIHSKRQKQPSGEQGKPTGNTVCEALGMMPCRTLARNINHIHRNLVICT